MIALNNRFIQGKRLEPSSCLQTAFKSNLNVTQAVHFPEARPTVYKKKKILCLIQLSMKFFLLINVKMPTIVGISTFMSRKNSNLDLSKPEK